MAEEKAKKSTKVKKKSWVQILAPKSFGNDIIGEIYVFEAESLIGRDITVNLMSLTGDMKKQNTNLKFVIDSLEGSKAITTLEGYYLVPASVRRLVRRGKKRLDLSFTCRTSDNKKVRIKPLLIPLTKVKSSSSHDLRRATISHTTERLSKMTFENVVRELMNYKLQKSLKEDIKKIYPVRILEVSALYIEKDEKPVENKKEVRVEAKEEIKKEEKVEKKKEEVKEDKKEVPKEKKQEEKKEDKKEKPVEEKKEVPKEAKEEIKK